MHPLLVFPHLVVVDKVGITFITGVVAHFEVDHPDVILDVNNQPSTFYIRANCPNLSVVTLWMSSFHVIHQGSHLKTSRKLNTFLSYVSCTHFLIAEGADLNPSKLHRAVKF